MEKHLKPNADGTWTMLLDFGEPNVLPSGLAEPNMIEIRFTPPETQNLSRREVDKAFDGIMRTIRDYMNAQVQLQDSELKLSEQGFNIVDRKPE